MTARDFCALFAPYGISAEFVGQVGGFVTIAAAYPETDKSIRLQLSGRNLSLSPSALEKIFVRPAVANLGVVFDPESPLYTKESGYVA